jgi:hypothetical protein
MGLCSMAIGAGIVLATLFASAIRHIGHNAGLWRPIWLGEAAVGLRVTVLSIVVLKPVPLSPGSPPNSRCYEPFRRGGHPRLLMPVLAA